MFELLYGLAGCALLVSFWIFCVSMCVLAEIVCRAFMEEELKIKDNTAFRVFRYFLYVVLLLSIAVMLIGSVTVTVTK